MRRSPALTVSALLLLAVAAPALALEDGIVEASSVTPSEELTSAVFEHTITNVSDGVVDLAPRDLRSPEYPTITVTEITAGSFADGIWTIGQLDPGQTASISYAGAVLGPAPTPDPTELNREELPSTGPRERPAMLIIVAFGMVALGISLLRTARA